MTVSKVSLAEMLSARDARAARQKVLQQEYRMPMVSFTMNMAGEYKRTPLSEYAFRAGYHAIKAALDEALIRRHLSPGGSADLLALALFMNETDMEREP